ncbi:MAG TPA: toprim domain-containing protein [Prolixibacteraceae bacterium]|nr:toprim domain-containing protein [Prolixibacteraceae bacterium]
MKDFSNYGITVPSGRSGNVKTTCPNCSKVGKQHLKDNCLSVNIDDGVWKCHKCGWIGCVYEHKEKIEYSRPEKKNFTALSDENLHCFTRRGITQAVVNRNKITDSATGWISFNYFVNGELINYKFRHPKEKDFRQHPGGQQVIYKYDDVIGKDVVIITEGEFDALALEVAGFKNACSVSQGAPNPLDKNTDKKLACITNCFDVFEQATTIIIATDNDPNGKNLRDILIKKFKAEKCKVVNWPDGIKDANEALFLLGVDKLKELIENASYAKIEGVFTVEDCTDQMLYNFQHGKNRGTTTYFQGLDEHFTWRTSEVTIVTGYNNEGKSKFLRQLLLLKSFNDDWRHAIFCPEDLPIEEIYDDFIHSLIGKNIDKIYSNVMEEAEYRAGIDFIRDKVFVIDPMQQTLENILERASYLIRRYDVKTLTIDPYNQVWHEMATGEREDLYISRFMASLKYFAVKHDICLILVAHQVTPIVEKNKNYPKPNLYRVKGGGTFADKADNVLFVWRQNRNTNKKDTSVKVGSDKIKKQMLVGFPGEIDLEFNPASNRYFEPRQVSPLSNVEIVDNEDTTHDTSPKND